PPPPPLTLFPYTTLFRSFELARQLDHQSHAGCRERVAQRNRSAPRVDPRVVVVEAEVVEEGEDLHGERLVELDQPDVVEAEPRRSEEHTSELQSRFDLVC